MVQVDPENGLEICERCETRAPDGLEDGLGKYFDNQLCPPGNDCIYWARFYEHNRDVLYAWRWGIAPEALNLPEGFGSFALANSSDG